MPQDVRGGKINLKTLQIIIRNIILDFKFKETFYYIALNTTAYFVTFLHRLNRKLNIHLKPNFDR